MSKDGPRRRGAVTIGVITGELARFQLFQTCLFGAMAAAPRGSRLVTAMGVDLAGNCNTLVRETLQHDTDWLWIMGDDHAFAPELLPTLVAHDVDVVVPHCLKRNPPWMPVVFAEQDAEGTYVTAELPEQGLVPVHAAGSAGMLIRRKVLEAIADPWFEPDPLGTGLNEDLYFCQKVRDAGFQIHCDAGALLGHISIHTVWPRWDEGRWHIGTVHDSHTEIPIRRIDPVPHLSLIT